MPSRFGYARVWVAERIGKDRSEQKNKIGEQFGILAYETYGLLGHEVDENVIKSVSVELLHYVEYPIAINQILQLVLHKVEQYLKVAHA